MTRVRRFILKTMCVHAHMQTKAYPEDNCRHQSVFATLPKKRSLVGHRRSQILLCVLPCHSRRAYWVHTTHAAASGLRWDLGIRTQILRFV